MAQQSGKASELTKRTLGDGMDNSLLLLSDTINKNLKLSSIPPGKSLKPIEPVGKIIKTIPKYIPNEKKKARYLVKKPKEPKFVPYEPFKGAVDPIIPRKKAIKVIATATSRNNVDIQDLVHQMSEMRATELNKVTTEALGKDDMLISLKQWEEERAGYETDIKNLRETNAHLENQLKFQAQVNGELKTLLVAAVGEDLETRVQHLTEDKLQLARALLNSANHLTSHQEQTEWLSGQCEVWRSKFLASSLMVEELARWKSALSNRINELQDSMKLLIEERTKCRNYALNTYNLLNQIHDSLKCDEPPKKIRTANIIDLTLNNLNLSEAIAGKIADNIKFDDELLKLSANTPGENAAVKILKNPVTVLGKQDAVCNALMGAVMSANSGQMYLQHPSKQATCCTHCKGEILDL